MLDRIMRQANLLEKGLDASWKRNELIAGNIAHADTPGYQSRHVAFESAFQRALKPDSFSLRSGRTAAENPKHIAFSDQGFTAEVITSGRSAMRLDGNNVDVDREMVELAQNQIVYDTLTFAMARELGRIRLVIKEGK